MEQTKTMKKLYTFIFLNNIKFSDSMFYKAEWIAESELPHKFKIINVWCICQIQKLCVFFNDFLVFIDERFVLNNLISLEEIKNFGIDLERSIYLRKKYGNEKE